MRTEIWRCGSRDGRQPSKSKLPIAVRTTSLAVEYWWPLRHDSMREINDSGRSNVSGADGLREFLAIRATGLTAGDASARQHLRGPGGNENVRRKCDETLNLGRLLGRRARGAPAAIGNRKIKRRPRPFHRFGPDAATVLLDHT